MIVMGVYVAIVAMSRSPVLAGSALVFACAAWTASITLFNVGVPLAAPRCLMLLPSANQVLAAHCQ
jgi:hypothetical protein